LPKAFYSQREIRGARIYDSEGLYYGDAGSLILREEGAYIEVFLTRSVGESVIDAEALYGELARRGLSTSGLTLEAAVEVARSEGIEIPRRRAEREVSLLKAYCPVSEIAWVDASIPEFRVILLRTPREASFRGQPPLEPPAFPRPGEVDGKPVLSVSNGFLGFASEIVVGPGELGVRVARGGGSVELKWMQFIHGLKRRGASREADVLAGEIDPYANPRLSGALVERAREAVARVLGPAGVRELESYLEVSRSEYVDVPWSSVRKLGDALVVA